MPGIPHELLEGREALDYIMAQAMPQLVNVWNGDENAVALVLEIADQPDSFGIGWGVRGEVVEDLRRRSAEADELLEKQKLLVAATTLVSPPSPGHVSCLVSGWGDVVTIEIEAEDLRMGSKITSWKGGTA